MISNLYFFIKNIRHLDFTVELRIWYERKLKTISFYFTRFLIKIEIKFIRSKTFLNFQRRENFLMMMIEWFGWSAPGG